MAKGLLLSDEDKEEQNGYVMMRPLREDYENVVSYKYEGYSAEDLYDDQNIDVKLLIKDGVLEREPTTCSPSIMLGMIPEFVNHEMNENEIKVYLKMCYEQSLMTLECLKNYTKAKGFM